MKKEGEYVDLFTYDLMDFDRDLYHDALCSFALMMVRLLRGLNRAEELGRLREQVARLTKEVWAVVEERDRAVAGASKDAETHRALLTEAKETAAAAEKLRLQEAEVNEAALQESVADGHATLIDELMVGFQERLTRRRTNFNANAS